MAYQFNTVSRVPCEIDGCDTDFARLAHMQRHVKEHHGSPLLCPEASCSWRGLKRKGRLEDHLHKAHADIHKGVELIIPDDFEPLSPSRTFNSTHPRHLSPRRLDPETRDSLAETTGVLHVSDDHNAHSPTAAPATSDWQPSTVSARHDETAFLSSDLNPSPQIYPSHDRYDERPLPAAQTQQHGPNRVVKGTSGSSERIDPSYKVRHGDYKDFFRIGRVFSTLWTDALGNNAGKVDPTFVSEELYGEGVYSKIRRFIVVREGERFVNCLPVTSYGNEGIEKIGIRLDEHGFIYSRNKHRKVEGMCSRQLKLNLAQGAAHLKDPSLVNYGKVYNVETNVRVKNVGTLDPDSKSILIRYFRKIYSGIEDPGGVGMTPRASEATLFGVGAALGSYPAHFPPVPYILEADSGSGFASASTTYGFPPAPSTVHGAPNDIGVQGESSTYYPPSSQHEPSSMSSSPHGLRYTSENMMDSSRRASNAYYPASARDSYYNQQGGTPPPPPNSGYSSSSYFVDPPTDYPLTSADYYGQAGGGIAQPAEGYQPSGGYSFRPLYTEPAPPSDALCDDNIDLGTLDTARQEARKRREIRSDQLRYLQPRTYTKNLNPKTSTTTSDNSKQYVVDVEHARSKGNNPPSKSPLEASSSEPTSIHVPYSEFTNQLGSPFGPNTSPATAKLKDQVSETAGKSFVPLHPAKSDSMTSAKELATSRRSSVDSIESLFSLLALSSTTASSIDNASGGAHQLCDFLSKQPWFQALAKDALQKVSPGKFEDNLRRSLVQFSAHLKAESSSLTMTQAARAVRRFARNAASLFRQSLDASENENQLAPVIASSRQDQDDDEDDDEDDDDLLENKEEGEEDASKLELVLSKSVAFRLLEENLRLFVHPDPVKKALFQVWPISHSRDSALEINHSLEWEVPHSLSTYFAEGQKLGNILTLTGDAINAQAQSCGDYLVQTWPEIGPALLSSLQHGLSSLETLDTTQTSQTMLFDIKLLSNSDLHNPISNASITALQSHSVHEQIITALSWISASIRHSPFVNLAYSHCLVFAGRSSSPIPTIAIQLANLEEIRTDQPCWHPLLPHAVIAKGFPIRDRTSGKGLDISFADMALLSQSMSFTEYDNGLILEGLRSVLIPMKILFQDDAIQWHLEYKRQTKPPKKKTIPQVFEMAQVVEWYKLQTPDELVKKRCFLGWAEEVAVMIGTLEFSNSKVYRSEALPTPKTRRVKSHNISMGASCFGIIEANGSKTWQNTSVPSSATLETDKDIYETLADDFNATVLIYDTREKTAWLLPQPSVVLYLTHKILKRRKFPLFDGDYETEFKFAKPGPDGAREAYSILQKLIEFKVQKSPTFQDKLSKTVKQICFQLDFLGDRLAFATSEFELIGGSEGANLYGFELNEVLEMKSGVDIMQVKVEQPWNQMIRKRGIVLFCAGLGQPIIPKSSESLCPAYGRVPALRNFLVTTGAVLHAFIEPYDQGPLGCTLGKRVEWIKDESLIQSHGQHTPVFHEQSLRMVENSTPDLLMLGLVSEYTRSGFIFTDNHSRSACLEVLAPTKSTFLNVFRHKVGGGNKTLPHVPDDDSASETSNQSEIGLSKEQMPTSSISSDESPLEEKGPEPSNIHSLSSTATSTWDSRDSAYVTDSSPLRHLSIASSLSLNKPRTAKNDEGGILGAVALVGKGKGLVSVKKPCDDGTQSSEHALYGDGIDFGNLDTTRQDPRKRREMRSDRRRRR